MGRVDVPADAPEVQIGRRLEHLRADRNLGMPPRHILMSTGLGARTVNAADAKTDLPSDASSVAGQAVRTNPAHRASPLGMFASGERRSGNDRV